MQLKMKLKLKLKMKMKIKIKIKLKMKKVKKKKLLFSSPTLAPGSKRDWQVLAHGQNSVGGSRLVDTIYTLNRAFNRDGDKAEIRRERSDSTLWLCQPGDAPRSLGFAHAKCGNLRA